LGRGSFARVDIHATTPGLEPVIDHHFKTSGCGSIYRSQMSQLSVLHPTFFVRQCDKALRAMKKFLLMTKI
jgi:hypothetical protein